MVTKKKETPAEEEFKKVGEKIKAEVAAGQEQKEEARELAVNSLDTLAKNDEMAALYGASADLGSDNISGELPVLKIHAAGKSTNELEDGEEPNDGWFFYKATGEQFETVRAHILTISRGYRTEPMEQSDNQKKVFTQVMGGVFWDDLQQMRPFIMYFTGMKLAPMWEFGKEVAKYKRKKPVPIPMFALSVRMRGRKEKTKYGRTWLIDFEIEKTETGDPILVLDKEVFVYLRDHVEEMEARIADVIASTEVVENKPTVKQAMEVQGADTTVDDFPDAEPTKTVTEDDHTEDVNPDDVPF